jgi:type II secretory pathway component PulF
MACKRSWVQFPSTPFDSFFDELRTRSWQAILNIIKRKMKQKIRYMVIFSLVNLLILFSYFVTLTLYAPPLADLYADLAVDTPVLTRMLFDVSNFVVNYWFFLIPFFGIVAIAVGLAEGWIVGRIEKKSVVKLIFLVQFLLFAAAVIFVGLATYLPLFSLANEIG